jgi:Lysozyme like domain
MSQVQISGKSTQGVNASFLAKFMAAVSAVGGTKVRVISGYRQPGVPIKNLYGQTVTETSSPHNLGLALDSLIYIPGRGWVPAGTALKNIASQFGLRSGDQPGFYEGNPDPNHVDAMNMAGTAPAGTSKTGDKSPPNGRLSFQQIESLWIQAGGNKQLAPIMAAVALAESKGDPNAHNYNPATGDDSWGLWQINYYGANREGRTREFGPPDSMRNPANNARAAVTISGNTTKGIAQNWSTYRNGAFLQYLSANQQSPAQTFLSDPFGLKNDVSSVGMDILYVAVILGGGAVIILGLLMIGLDLGLSGFKAAEKAPPIRVARAISGHRARKASGEAKAQSSATTEARRAELHEAKVKTEKARATDLRSRSRARTTLARQTKAEREKTEKAAYIRGAVDAQSPTLTQIRRKRAS